MRFHKTPMDGAAVALRPSVIDRLQQPATEHAHRIRQELLGYLHDNPGAMDTLEGIAAWWLPRHEIRVGVELVARALEQLESEGLIERTGDPGCPLFRLRITTEPGSAGSITPGG